MENEKRLRMLLEAISDGVWEQNLVTGEVYRSPNAYTTLGYSPNDLEPTKEAWENLLHPTDKDRVLKAIDDHIEGRTDKFRAEHRTLNKAGDWQWILSRGKVVEWDKKNNPIRLIGTVEDISEYKRTEKEKAALLVQLQQAQKMEAIGTLAGGIAHDFNNILSPIMIHSEMVMSDLPPDSPLHFNLKEIYKAGGRARDLVKQILTFGRQTEHKRTPLKVGIIVKEVLKLLRSSLPATIEIHQNIATESDTVLIDPTQINQLLVILCTNSGHAMREKGGILEVNLVDEYLDSDAASNFPDLSPGPYLRLTVSDTGHGMDDETMKRIFTPYFTTKGFGEGTGMGLAVVHGILKSSGGDISVESEPGKGTSFHALLPIIEAEVSPITEPVVDLPRGTERILFIDDEKAAIDAIQPMLTNLGYKVTSRTSSIEALEAFKNKFDAFDLVITDQTMPNMTGKELTQKLMKIRPDIPIILCTGYSEMIDEEEAKEMGISFVMKPIIMREIANTIRQVLDGR